MQNKVVTRQSLALLAKLSAVGGAIAGVLLIPPPQVVDRAVVVMVPGVSEEQIVSAMAAGRAPHLAAFAASGLVAEVDTRGAISGQTFWRRALAGAAPASADDGVGGAAEPIWSWFGERTAVLGVPPALFPEVEERREPGAADAASAFAGSSAPVPLDGRDLRAARLPAPFEALGERARLAAADMTPGRWSDWIDAGEGSSERFQVLSGDDEHYFLSPLYRTATQTTSPPSRVVVADPFLVPVEPALRSAFVEHLVSVDETRCVAAERLLRSRTDLRSLFYGFTVAVSARRLFDKDAPPDSSTYARVISVMDQQLARVSEAAGERGLLLVVGGPGLDRQRSTRAWLLLSTGTGEPLERLHLDVPGMVRLIRYSLGVSFGATDREGIPASVLARYPRRVPVATKSGAQASPQPPSPWSADALETLLRVPGS